MQWSIARLHRSIVDVQRSIVDLQWSIVDLQSMIVDLQSTIADVQWSIVDVEWTIADVLWRIARLLWQTVSSNLVDSFREETPSILVLALLCHQTLPSRSLLARIRPKQQIGPGLQPVSQLHYKPAPLCPRMSAIEMQRILVPIDRWPTRPRCDRSLNEGGTGEPGR